jgi:hypothetical protein
MLLSFPASYQCIIDPEFPAAGAFPNLYSSRSLSQPPRHALIIPDEGERWHAELGASAIGRGGLTGFFSAPSPRHVLIVFEGRAYYLDTHVPGSISPLEIEPIKSVHALVEHGLLLAISPWEVVAYGHDGRLWTSPRIAADGIEYAKTEEASVALRIDEGDGFGDVILDLATGSPR